MAREHPSDMKSGTKSESTLPAKCRSGALKEFLVSQSDFLERGRVHTYRRVRNGERKQ